MDLLFLAIMAVVAMWVARRAGFYISDQSVSVLVRGFRASAGVRGWPRGVQEEDRDRPWGKGPPPKSEPDRAPTPMLVRVKPAVRVR